MKPQIVRSVLLQARDDCPPQAALSEASPKHCNIASVQPIFDMHCSARVSLDELPNLLLRKLVSHETATMLAIARAFPCDTRA
jgi:hypothetical protein